MLEKISDEKFATIAKPNNTVVKLVTSIVERTSSPEVAEIGVGIGATTLAIARIMNNSGRLHIFDFEDSVLELSHDLKKLGFSNIVGYGNSKRYWDSYHWSLQKLISAENHVKFDLIYIDGAHTYLHDLVAFFQADRLAKIGSVIVFDDYEWSYSQSGYMKAVRDNYMTKEQEEEKQVKLVVDQFVKNNEKYRELIKNKAYVKER